MTLELERKYFRENFVQFGFSEKPKRFLFSSPIEDKRNKTFAKKFRENGYKYFHVNLIYAAPARGWDCGKISQIFLHRHLTVPQLQLPQQPQTNIIFKQKLLSLVMSVILAGVRTELV